MTKLPSPSELAPVVVDVIKEMGGTAHFKDIEKAVIKKLGLSNEATSQIRSGKRTEFAYRLSWARTYNQFWKWRLEIGKQITSSFA
jgi:restriction endonuclease Mrr